MQTVINSWRHLSIVAHKFLVDSIVLHPCNLDVFQLQMKFTNPGASVVNLVASFPGQEQGYKSSSQQVSQLAARERLEECR